MNIRTPYLVKLPLHISTTLEPNIVETMLNHLPSINKTMLLNSYQPPESDLYIIDLELDIYYTEMKSFICFVETCNTGFDVIP